MENFYFMQDGAPLHCTKPTFDFLGHHFEDGVIALDCSREISWPPTHPCDFFLWGYLKDQMYATVPRSIEELTANIRRAICNISEDVFPRVNIEFE